MLAYIYLTTISKIVSFQSEIIVKAISDKY